MLQKINSKQGSALDFLVFYLTTLQVSRRNMHPSSLFFFQKTKNSAIEYNTDYDILEKEINNFCTKYDIDCNEDITVREVVLDQDAYNAHKIFDSISKRVDTEDFTDDYLNYIGSKIDIKSIIPKDKKSYHILEEFDVLFEEQDKNRLLDYINTFLESINWVLINEAELVEMYNAYYYLRQSIPGIYISYYTSMIHYLNFQGKILLERFVREINGIYHSNIISEVSSKSNYLKYLISENEKQLFKYSFEIPQVDGFYIENYLPTLSILSSADNYISILENSKIYRHSAFLQNINLYSFRYINVEHSLYGMKLKYLKQLLFGDNFNPTDSLLSDEFNFFLNEKDKFIDYLKQKDFDDAEINMIINTLSENRFSSLNIKAFKFYRDIDFFRFCYFFYVFDYFEEVENKIFDKISSFNNIVGFHPNNERENKQQYLKNYLNLDNSYHKDYPFADSRTDIFLSEIESALRISREKLKPIPKPKLY